MMNEIPIKELEVRLKERLQGDSYSKSYVVNHTGSLKYLVAYMECKGLQFYSSKVGELFADYVSNPQIISYCEAYAPTKRATLVRVVLR